MKGNSFVPFMKRKGDGSTLNLDFTKMSALDSRFTFTRSTTATYINSSGYVATMAAAATNDPTKARFDYNPTTLAPNGLLIEGQTTNLTKRSDNAFTNSYWETTSSNVDAADSSVTSPTGVESTASTLTERYALGASVSRHVHQLIGEFTPTVSTSYTMSAWVKQPASAAIRYVQLAFWTAGFGATAYMNFDIQAGTVGTGGAGITASTITAYPSGWYRITATAPATATGSSGFQLGFSTTSGAARTESYTITSGSEKSIYLWGAQVEAGVGASSYYPTTTSQGTRIADSCNIGTIAPFNYSTTNGTLFYSGIMTKQNAASYPIRVGFYNTSDTKCFSFYTNVNTLFFAATGNATAEATKSYTLNTLFKAAMSFDASLSTAEVILNFNGSTGATGATALTATNTPNQFSFGQAGYEAYFPCGTIAAVKYWNTTKTAAELAALTL
jgi:hypothetical protein